MTYNMRICPRCKGKRTSWRKGHQFDHERICWACMKSYDPADEEKKAKVTSTVYGDWKKESK